MIFFFTRDCCEEGITLFKGKLKAMCKGKFEKMEYSEMVCAHEQSSLVR